MTTAACYAPHHIACFPVLEKLCLRYVNWVSHRYDNLFVDMRLEMAVSPKELAIPGVEIRSLADIGGIPELLRIYNTAYVGARDYHKAGWIERLAIQASSGFDPGLIWIACDSERPLGFSMARRSGAEGQITGLGVLPEWRGRKLGKALVLKALCRLVDEGATTITASVDRDCPKSISICEGLGFRRP